MERIDMHAGGRRPARLGLVAVGAVAAVVAVLALVAAHGAGAQLRAATLVVDDDRAQCADAQYTTIQAAVDAAAAGDTIRVCPGSYAGATVDKAGLTLVGATDVPSSAACVAGSGGGDPARDSIVSGGSSAPGFAVVANDVTIAGFTVEGSSAGVQVANEVSGTRVLRDVLQRNTMGVYLNSSGDRLSRVERNCIRANNAPGAASGNGVYSDSGLGRAAIRNNTFTGQENASVILLRKGGTISRVDVSANRIVKDASVILANLVDSRVARNLSDSSNGSGIFLAGGSSDVAIVGNVVRDCAYTGVNVRYLPGDYDVSSANTKLLVASNRVSGCGDAGIRLRDGAASSVVRDNVVSANGTGADKGDGIALENADDNLLARNRSSQNGRDGLRADESSTGNRIVGNRASGNGEHDCHDDSNGDGTAGTANTWSGDVGATENRDGLCTAPSAGGGDKGHKGDKGDKGDKGEKGDGKVAICHETGSGKYVRITVSRQGARAHLRKHRDVAAEADGSCPARVADDDEDKGGKKKDGSSKHAAKARANEDGHGGKGRGRGHRGS